MYFKIDTLEDVSTFTVKVYYVFSLFFSSKLFRYVIKLIKLLVTVTKLDILLDILLN